jgi:hypothetical protein
MRQGSIRDLYLPEEERERPGASLAGEAREVSMSMTVVARVQDPAEAISGEMEISVVMPCLDEARTVGRCVEKALRAIAGLGVRGEVVVADNESINGSQEIAHAPSRRGEGTCSV